MRFNFSVLRLVFLTWLGLVTATDYPLARSMTQNTTSLQDIVTWDERSLFVHGERIILLSGEFHPFRLPSPGLWLDVFQKIRALGYSGASFYVDWALVEGEPGQIRMDGVFALEEFFDAAQQAGIYLIARPGPYINAETSGGGFPGWLQRLNGRLKRTDPAYLAAITPYIEAIGNVISNAQITKGGPIILLQVENEYSLCVVETGYTQANNYSVTSLETSCLEKEYMAYIERLYRKLGVLIPFIFNDAVPLGNFAPGTGVGEVDIYGFDDYPLGWSTAPSNSSDWSGLTSPLSSYNYTVHEKQSPTTPFAISEFQGGCPDGWGGVGVETSAAYIGPQFARIFYKLNFSFRAAIHSLYMIFGGTNWGNLGHPGGYTSYDVGAAIREDRQVIREKYSEMKLQAGLLQASPAYLLSNPDNGSYGVYTDSSTLVTTRLRTNSTNFFFVRHENLASDDTISYKLQVPTSIGNMNIPQLGGSLSLHGRDSKIHVVDYDVGGINLIYSSAEVFSWKKSGSKSVLILYGGEDEIHEFAIPGSLGLPSKVEGPGLIIRRPTSTATIIHWSVEPSRRVVHFGNDLEIHLLWRNDAYNHWVLDLPLPAPIGRHASPSRANSSVIVKAGYLVRTAEISGSALKLTGDINATTDIEIIAAPSTLSSLFFNDEKVKTKTINGRLQGRMNFVRPHIELPDLKSQKWHFVDSLPEIQPGYDDSQWTPCNHTHSYNPRNLTTPTSLYSSDYGYSAGSLIYRGEFTANGSETTFYLLTEGGYGYGHSVWLNSVYLDSWAGSGSYMLYNQTLALSDLKAGEEYIITVLIDHLGNDENFPANTELMKDPRGLIDYSLNGRDKEAISWKITGNLGGEQYRDHSRGPFNEGGFYAERQGFHLPGAPVNEWKPQSPFAEITQPGVGFWATSFDLDLPVGYDIPLSVQFTNSTVKDSSIAKFRSELFVNGWQFGKYVNNVGPQTRFPVPEGILNYNGPNYLALTIWSMNTKPFQLAGLQLQADAVIQSGYSKPDLVQGLHFTERLGSY